MDESLIAEYPDLEQVHFWWKVRRYLVRSLARGVHVTGARVLDVGCGSGTTALMFEALGASAVGVDSSFDGSADEAPGVEFVHGDYIEEAGRLGLFKLVLALDSVEHFPSESEVLKAIASNVEQGGYAFITVPAYKWLWSSHDVANHHYRRYTRRSLAHALSEAGLSVSRIGYAFGALVPIKACLALADRLSRKSVAAGTGVNPVLNRIAFRFFRMETRLGLRLRNFLPFGTSVVAVAQKLEIDA